MEGIVAPPFSTRELWRTSKIEPVTKPTVYRDPTMNRDSPYSYVCGACSRCCHNYLIRVNPYEVLRLAQHLDLSTTAFIEEYVTPETALVHKPDDSCIFLGPHGCSVHSARPLVCRLYPLGRHISSDGEERFYHMAPHPDTEGIYGEDGSVGDYLRSQGALPFLAAADRYLAIFLRYFRVLSELPKDGLLTEYNAEKSGQPSPPLPELLNPDNVIDIVSLGSSISKPDPERVMALHIKALEVWLSQFQPGENGDEKQD